MEPQPVAVAGQTDGGDGPTVDGIVTRASDLPPSPQSDAGDVTGDTETSGPGPSDCAALNGNAAACKHWVPLGNGCTETNRPTGYACSDDNPCTLQDECNGEGMCLPGDGLLNCEDGNPCTTDHNCQVGVGCNFAPHEPSWPCDDGDPCTVGESCQSGLCEAPSAVTTCAACDGTDPSFCEEAYGDDDDCNGTMACTGGACKLDPTTVVHVPPDSPCASYQCDQDGNIQVQYGTDTTNCDDGDPCTMGTHCLDGGTCGGGQPKPDPLCDCSDSTAEDACAGLQWDHCLGEMVCTEERCTLTPPESPCGDGLGPCKAASCHPDVGCVVTELVGFCDHEGLPVCTYAAVCMDGVCQPQMKDCTNEAHGGLPPIPCGTAQCDGETGACVYETNSKSGSPCEEALGPCYTTGECQDGACLPTGDHACDDGLPCTNDYCEAGEGGYQCSYDPPHPTCSGEGVCANSSVTCQGEALVCNYGEEYSQVEWCSDNKDNNCDGDVDEEPCASSIACETSELVALPGGVAQACAAPDGVSAATSLACATGWHWCTYSEMLTHAGADGVAPPPGLLIAATISYETEESAYSAISDELASTCQDLQGDCGSAHSVQAITSAEGTESIPYAKPAWECALSADGVLEPAGSCEEGLVAGVLCCPDACGQDGQCDDGDPCTTDTCLLGHCQTAPKPEVACPSKGVCATAEPTCTNESPSQLCDLSVLPHYETEESTCDALDNDCDGLIDEGVEPGAQDACSITYGGICTNLEPICQNGAWSCIPQTVEGYEPVETSCDGLDTNCDGATDEAFLYEGTKAIGQECSPPGVCADGGPGQVECGPGGTAAVCSNGPGGTLFIEQVEVCNGLDDDCDEAIDEDVDPGDSFSCEADGVCAALVPVCDEGLWACPYGSLEGYEPEGETLCDGRDNDCDGVVDDGLILSGTFEALGDGCGGEATATNTEACEGVVVCNPGGPQLPLLCNVAMGYETCDLVDNDCNGVTDEGLTYLDPALGILGKGQACTRLGACADSPTPAFTDCALDTGALICTPNLEGTPETCNGIDDDCDHNVDEGFTWNGLVIGAACIADGLGICSQGEGLVECGLAGATCSTLPGGTASPAHGEECDAQDNDCDGSIDEGPLDALTGSGCFAGVCTAENTVATCSGGQWTCERGGAEASGYTPTDDSCDGVDNDCDGVADQDVPDLGEPCDTAADDDLCKLGTFTCNADQEVVCAGDAPIYEQCNGLDDDCDELIDEDLGTVTCGLGACLHEVQNCQDGTPQQCDPTEGASAEVCNGLDDDCDGIVDGPPAALAAGDPELCLSDPKGVCVGVLSPSLLCADGVWGECTPEHLASQIGPTYQQEEGACDGLDNDCDGYVDGEDPGVALTAPLCDKQEGVCFGSTAQPAQCQDFGWGSCGDADYEASSGDYESGFERSCDGLDNDCDGHVDDGFLYEDAPIGALCEGEGECGPGWVVCTADGERATCSSNGDAPGENNAEIEECNGLDDDCDGSIDEGLDYLSAPCFAGICTPEWMQPECAGASGWVCDPSNVPGYMNPEATCDGLDNDCDGHVDEGFPGPDDLENGALPGTPCQDEDSSCETGVLICNPDGDDLICSSNEICNGADDDCDGKIDEHVADVPCDGTGECAATSGYLFCDENQQVACSANEGAADEICDELDNDCNGLTDDGLFLNGAPLGAPCNVNTPCAGLVVCGDDLTAVCSTSPAAGGGLGEDVTPPEVCDGEDQDCDGTIDEDVTPAPDQCLTEGVCAGSLANLECSEGAWSPCTYHLEVYLEGQEICDFLDNDCDGTVDEGFELEGAHVGASCDGEDPDLCSHGEVTCVDETTVACEEKLHLTEVCTPPDGFIADEDCDGDFDEPNAGDCSLYFYDGDLDGYGHASADGDLFQAACLCEPDVESGYTATGLGDCDDEAPGVNPGLLESCTVGDAQPVDENCNEEIDEPDAFGCTTYLRDEDGDGYGVEGNKQCLCAPTHPYTVPAGGPVGDCDDGNAAIHPGHTEVCGDGVDHNCDLLVDSEGAQGCTLYYRDADADGYGDPNDAKCLCSPDGQYHLLSGDDCCDASLFAKPGQTAWFSDPVPCVGQGYDWNCDGSEQTERPVVGECFCSKLKEEGECKHCDFTEGWAGVSADDVPGCGEAGFLLDECDDGDDKAELCSPKKFSDLTTQRCH